MVPLFALSLVLCRPLAAHSQPLAVVSATQAADSLLDAARDAIGRGLSWRASLLLGPVLADPARRTPEAVMLAEASGIDAARLPQCLAGGHADGSLLQRLYPQMHQRAFEPRSSYARQLLKDMKAVSAFAQGLGLDLKLIEQGVQRFDDYVALGHEMSESAGIVMLYEHEAAERDADR